MPVRCPYVLCLFHRVSGLPQDSHASGKMLPERLKTAKMGFPVRARTVKKVVTSCDTHCMRFLLFFEVLKILLKYIKKPFHRYRRGGV